MSEPSACDDCLRRSWLVARLGDHLERIRGRGGRLPEALALPEEALIAALAGERAAAIRAELRRMRPRHLRTSVARAGLEAVCRCRTGRYPAGLELCADAPAVLYVAGDPDWVAAATGDAAVAIVGARRASAYGLEVARGLARGLGAAGVTVVSGMALGIDSAAHEGALAAGGATLAVLPAGLDRPYPVSKRSLFARIVASGAAIAEHPPGTRVWKWSFPARNRMIAALAAVTVVVEAGERSGSLITADLAGDLGREVAAVPGHVTSRLTTGTHALLSAGAALVTGPADVLELLALPPGAVPPARPRLADPVLQRVLDAVGEGHDSVGALVAAGLEPGEVLVALGRLEALGRVRRLIGGRFVAAA